jgi:hypothetical protein
MMHRVTCLITNEPGTGEMFIGNILFRDRDGAGTARLVVKQLAKY